MSQPTTAGVAVHVRNIVRGAVESGFEVIVICPPGGDLAGWVGQVGAAVHEVPLTRSPRPSDIRHVLELRRVFRRVDLVHLHSSKAGALGRLAVRTMRAADRPPCVFTPHGWSWYVGGRLSRLYEAIERMLKSSADVTIAVSAGEAAAGAAVLGQRALNLRVIENGVDTEHFSPGPARDTSPSGLRLLCVGRLGRQKGQDIALQALARLDRRDVRIAFAGTGEDESALRALADSLGIQDRVDWLGQLDDTAPAIREADVVVVPSRWEGLSLALLEAMACAAPIVATEIPGNEVLDGVGRLVPPENPVALAEAIAELLDSPDLRTQLGERARQRVCSGYRLEESVSRTLRVWSDLLDSSSQS